MACVRDPHEALPVSGNDCEEVVSSRLAAVDLSGSSAGSRPSILERAPDTMKLLCSVFMKPSCISEYSLTLAALPLLSLLVS